MSDESLEEAAEKNASWAMTAIGQLRKERDAALADRELHAQSAEAWRKRVEGAADALADVLPGEVGRLDLLARIAELKRQRDEWRRRAESLLKQAEGFEAELARLKPSGQVAEDAEQVREILGTHATEKTLGALSRLAAKAQSSEDWERKAMDAEKHPAVIAFRQERDAAVADNAALVEWIDRNGHARWCERAQGREFRCTDGCAAKPVTSHPHPGTALLERMKRLEAMAHGQISFEPVIETCMDGSCSKCKAGEPCH